MGCVFSGDDLLGSFNSFDHGATNSFIGSVAEQKGGKILVAGVLRQLDGAENYFLSRLNDDGSLDASFDVTINDEIASIELQDDSKILIGGDFGSVNGATRTQIARLENTAPPQIDIRKLETRKSEGNEGYTEFTFLVSRDFIDLQSTTTANYAVEGEGSAPADVDDFGGAFPQGMISFGMGEKEKTLTINVSADRDVESNESFLVKLSDSSNAIIDKASANGVIVDDDEAALCIPIQSKSGGTSMVCL